MPCNSEYMNPTDKEKKLQETAKLLIHVLKIMGFNPASPLIAASKDMYCSHDYVDALCSRLSTLSTKQKKLLLHGQDRVSRDLMNWWEDHRAADVKRLKKEIKDNENAKKKALAKLTPAERKLLGL